MKRRKATRKRTTGAGTVYFLRCPSNGFIKIGWTAGSPAARFGRIRSLSPVPLELAATHPGTVAEERALHERFAACWSHGEWFRPDPDLAAYIAAEATPWARTPTFKGRRAVAPAAVKPRVCEWAQDTKMTSRGITRTVAEWSRITGVSELALKFRLDKGVDPSDGHLIFWGGDWSRRLEWWRHPDEGDKSSPAG